MTSPDLIHELRESRPTAPAALRMRVRETVAAERGPLSLFDRFRFPARRISLVAVPATLMLAVVTAGAIGLSRSTPTEALRDRAAVDSTAVEAAPEGMLGSTPGAPTTSTDRAQRISATLTL
ncbi:MAG: hypothetical protein R6W48_04075, partial [Gaiellaceae bacterium]